MKNKHDNNDRESLTENEINQKLSKVYHSAFPLLGEISWLLSQSRMHKHMSFADLEWFVMPPILLKQYCLFHGKDESPSGMACWAYLNEEAEQRLLTTGRLAPHDWGNNATLDPEKGLVAREGGMPWLVEVIVPFDNKNHELRTQMIKYVSEVSLKGKKIKTLHIDPLTGAKKVIFIEQIQQ